MNILQCSTVNLNLRKWLNPISFVPGRKFFLQKPHRFDRVQIKMHSEKTYLSLGDVGSDVVVLLK
jgi:hypothetical protein